MNLRSAAAWSARSVLATLIAALVFAAEPLPLANGTNLPTTGYPAHKCAVPPPRPEKPFRTDEYSARTYNADVERYNRALTEFRDCMSTYVDNANNDIKRIQEAAKKALDDFRSLPQ